MIEYAHLMTGCTAIRHFPSSDYSGVTSMSANYSTRINPRVKDLTGQRFGLLTVLRFIGRNKHQKAQWQCQCDCGKETIVTGSVLLKGETKSCGCLRIANLAQSSFERRNDLAGQKFGKFTVIEIAGSDKYGKLLWRCRCECGNEVIVQGNNLVSGGSTCCKHHGHIKHGHAGSISKSRTYYAWSSMKKRCKPNDKDSHIYFDRGISVCEKWNEFNQFLLDMGVCPDGFELDRIDNNQGYFDGNCRWVDEITQRRNQRNIKMYEYNGQSMILIDWAKQVDIPYSTILQRLHKSQWAFEDAITTPVKSKQ